MSDKGLTRYEQETILNYNNEEKFATLYTADPVVMRRLDKLVLEFPEDYEVIRQDECSKTYKFSKKLILYRKPVHLTEEQKELARQNLAKVSKNN